MNQTLSFSRLNTSGLRPGLVVVMTWSSVFSHFVVPVDLVLVWSLGVDLAPVFHDSMQTTFTYSA